MEEWIASGVQLGWLIEGAKETVYIYRVNRPPEIRRAVLKLASEGPVRGFTVQLRPSGKVLNKKESEAGSQKPE